MKIYEMNMAPNPRRVRIFLAEKGIEMEYVQVDLQKGENRTEEFRKKNIMGRVPVLELDDGTCISESVAICRYFEEEYPEPSLLGKDRLERALIEMWQRRMELNLLVSGGYAFRHLSGFFADREKVIKEWGEVCFEDVQKIYEMLDQHLAESKFIAGENFSIADITALCTIDFAKIVKLRIKEEQKNLSRWYDEISGRPSARA